MVIKFLDRNKNDNIKVGIKCCNCGNELDHERFVYEIDCRRSKKQIILCLNCASILKNDI